MDLLREQVKMLAGEVALCSSSLKRLSEQAASSSGDSHIQACELHTIKFSSHANDFNIVLYDLVSVYDYNCSNRNKC